MPLSSAVNIHSQRVLNTKSVILALGVTLIVLPLGEARALQTAADRPNIIFILADDLGWSELGTYGNKFNETPNLDRLAVEGMRFTQAYACAPVCSPYRAGLLTGLHPARLGIHDYLRPNSANGLSFDHATLAEQLSQQGYSTGMIGKWHLSGYRHHRAEFETRPTDHGFQWNVGSEVKSVGNGANFWPYVFRTQPISWLDLPTSRLGPDEYLTDRLNVEAVEFIKRNRDRPFFLLLSHYAPHTILNGRSDLVEKYRQKHRPGPSTRERCYLCEDAGLEGDALHHWAGDHNPHLAAMLESIDDGIGKVMQTLRELELDDNTIVIFTSDNGGETNVTSNAPLRGGKSQLFEGGIRVPLIARWPAVIPAGTTCHHPTVNLDFYPTLLEASGKEVSPERTLDGVSVLGTLKAPERAPKRAALYWHYPLDEPHFLGGESAGAIRVGNWKLIESLTTGRKRLFDLNEDPSETNDLAEQLPEVTRDLAKRLDVWRDKVDARVPSSPVLTASRGLIFADHFSSLPLNADAEPTSARFSTASERWFFHRDWSAEEGMLTHHASGPNTSRVFLRDTSFKDVIVRFDFRLGQADELRLMTGSEGHYNAVIHIRKDHFFVQTAIDDRGPWFPFRHGECAFRFEPGRWYTLTVEMIGDELAAHLDHEHMVYARHPILDQTRDYFAFQAGEHRVDLDNVQILEAVARPELSQRRAFVEDTVGNFPVSKSLREAWEIRKRNAHETAYQAHEEYRELVQQVDDLDAERRRRFPDVFQTNKAFRRSVQDRRRELLASNENYETLLHATHRAERAVDDWLLKQNVGIEQLPASQYKRALELERRRSGEDTEYQQLIMAQYAAQRALESAFPELYVTDVELQERRARAREAAKSSTEFRDLEHRRAQAYRLQQSFLLEHDERLSQLQRKLDRQKDANLDDANLDDANHDDSKSESGK